MKRSLITIFVLLAIAVSVANSNTKVAVVYNSFHNYQYKDEMTPILKSLDYQFDMYENTHISELIPKLSEYNLVLMNAVYNYENSQDFLQYSKEWRDYLISGGCIISTDTNYPQQFQWLQKVDPGLRWVSSMAMNPVGDSPIKWVDKLHPLMKDVTPPGTPWTQPSSWSQALVPIASDGAERPVIAYLELGKGIAVISSAYRQYGFPDAAFLRNLMEWVKNPDRLASVAAKEPISSSLTKPVPALSIPHVTLSRETKQKGALIDGLYDFQGNPSKYKTRIYITSGDHAFYMIFESYNYANTAYGQTDGKRDFELWRDNCVEIFLKPSEKKSDVYHFAVDSSGLKYDALNDNPDWDAYWESSTNLRDGVLTTTIAIPYTSLGITASTPSSSIWTANFVRRYKGAVRNEDELSGWSPSPVGFDIPDRFGTLTNIRIDSSRYTYNPELSVVQSSRWIMGNNQVSIGLKDIKQQQPQVVLECMNSDTCAVIASKPAFTAINSKVEMNVSIGRDGPTSMQFVLRDAVNRNRIYSSSKVIKADVEPPITASLISPAFRNSILSKDSIRQLKIECDISNDVTVGTYLRADIIPSGRNTPVWQMSYPVKTKGKINISHSLADYAVGDYITTVEMLDIRNTVISRQIFDIKILLPASTEVSFDTKGICHVNGKPFFPIGLYHIAPVVLDKLNTANKDAGLPEINLPDTLTSIKDKGFNCVHHTWGMAGDEYMRITQDLGLYVIPEIGAPDPTILKEYVSSANKYNNLLMWYGLDEPSGERLNTAMAAHDMFTRIDPYRPVSAACCNPTVFKGAVKAYDILMMDPYFIRFAPLSQIADWMKTGLEATKGRKPIWVVPQAFTISSSPWSEPTPEELRCQAYISLVHGATGLIWYAFWTGEPYIENPKGRKQWYLPDSKLWDYFKVLNKEISEFTPVIINGDSLGSAKTDSPLIYTNIWKLNGTSYIVAVNPTGKPIECNISELKGKSAVEINEHRDVIIKADILHDSFKPLEVHVYRFHNSIGK